MNKTILFCMIILLVGTVGAGAADLKDRRRDAGYGYYMDKDSVTYRVLIEKNNDEGPHHKAVLSDDERFFVPDDILAYGYGDEEPYVSAEIPYNGQRIRVFLRRLVMVDPRVSVYMYIPGNGREVYYLTLDGGATFRQVEKDEPGPVWDVFAAINNCVPESYFPKRLTPYNVHETYLMARDCDLDMNPGFSFGIVAGAGVGRPGTNDSPEYKYGFRPSLSVGLFAQIPLDPFISLRPEVSYAFMDNKSGRPSVGLSDRADEERYNRHSLQIPLYFRYTFSSMNRKTVPFIEAGPLVDIMLSGGRFQDGKEIVSGDLADDSMIRTHWGFSGGFGFANKLANGRTLCTGVRYYRRLSYHGDFRERISTFALTASMSF